MALSLRTCDPGRARPRLSRMNAPNPERSTSDEPPPATDNRNAFPPDLMEMRAHAGPRLNTRFSISAEEVHGGCVKNIDPPASGPRTIRAAGVSDVAGGIAGIAAGLCWLLKSTVILVTGWQPPVIFELAPLLMSVAALVLASRLPLGRARTIACLAAVAAVVGSAVVLVDVVAELPRLVVGGAIALSTALILISLIMSGVSLWPGMRWTLPLIIGAMTMPSVLVGGLLAAVFGERLLEVPLVALGATWVIFGGILLQGRYASESKPRLRSP